MPFIDLFRQARPESEFPLGTGRELTLRGIAKRRERDKNFVLCWYVIVAPKRSWKNLSNRTRTIVAVITEAFVGLNNQENILIKRIRLNLDENIASLVFVL